MGTIKEKKDYLLATKEGIRQAVLSYEVELPEDATFRSYVDKVANIPSVKIDDVSYFFYKGLRYDQYEEINEKIFPYAKKMSHLFNGMDFDMKEPLPAELNTQSCEDFTSAFEGLTRFGYVPNIDLSKCKTMHRAFYGCEWLGNWQDFNVVPVWDTSNVEDMSYTFYKCQFALFRDNEGKMPQFNMQNVLTATYMFYKCWFLANVPELNTAKCTDFSYAFYDCDKLTTVESIDMTACTNAESMFQACLKLEDVTLKNVGVLENTTNMFSGCSALKRLVWDGCTVVPSFSIANCAFDRDGMVEMFNSLPSGGSSTITIAGNPCVDDGTLQETDREIATSKGYVLVEA